MRVYDKHGRVDQYLDYHQGKHDVRVDVLGILAVFPVNGMYFERRLSARLVLNYLQQIGPINVIRKVVSRWAEAGRNKKYVSIGLGKRNDDGSLILFVAPSHPGCVDKLVLPEGLVREPEEVFAIGAEGALRCGRLENVAERLRQQLEDAAGWSAESGCPVPVVDWKAVEIEVRRFDWGNANVITYGTKRAQWTEVKIGKAKKSERLLGATLFGYGNYAKTVILPNLPHGLEVTRIHELDPLQMPRGPRRATLDTSPELREDDENPVVLVAGFHHTHAPLAVKALNSGKSVAAEKPIVVDEDQLANLVAAAKHAGRRFFACFHKRYHPFNDLARKDLGVTLGAPVSYHCIVYEVPLPPRHWYRWSTSKSSIVSNGCHWLDHFLFMNGYAEIKDHELVVGPSGEVSVTVELENRAFFTMALTHSGSERIGVQEYIELRTGDVTVTQVNSSLYRSEDTKRVIRRVRMNKMRSYEEMYRVIGRKLIGGSEGDTLTSIERSSGLILSLDRIFREKYADRYWTPGCRM